MKKMSLKKKIIITVVGVLGFIFIISMFSQTSRKIFTDNLNMTVNNMTHPF